MFVGFDIDDTLLDHSRAERLAAARFFSFLRGGYEVPSILSEDAFVGRWRDLSKKHMTAFLANHLNFQEQRRERLRELLGKPLEDTEADLLFGSYLAFYKAEWQLFLDVLPCLDAL